MPKKKSVSFDAMVKFFMRHYKIPTKKDIEKLMTKMDRLESEITNSRARVQIGSRTSRIQNVRSGMTASDAVLEITRQAGDEGVGFAEIQDKTGFNEKKIRNIVFRLDRKSTRLNSSHYS